MKRRGYAFPALPVDGMAIPVAGFGGASPYVDLSPAPLKCFGASAGFGGMPATAYATTVAKAALTDKNNQALSSPEAQLAASVFEGAMSGQPGAAEAAISQAGATLAAAGAAAACAATGAGAAVAPLCAMAGSFIFGKVTEFLGGGDGIPCLKAQEQTAQALQNTYLAGGPANVKLFCDNDPACNVAVITASYDYADRINWWCSMFYNWPLTETIRAEGKKLGLPPWPIPKNPPAVMLGPSSSEQVQRAKDDAARYTYNFYDPRWAAFAKQKWLGEVTKAVAARKLKTWSKAAAIAKQQADAEYDSLVRLCPKTGVPIIRLFKKLTPCEQKAADAATIIAARSYMYATIDGAPAVQATEIAALRSQFKAEVAQDAAAAANAAAVKSLDDERQKKARDELSERIRASVTATENRPKIALALSLAAAVVVGGVYVYRTRHA